MKGVIKFLEDNNKWIVRILVIIGIFLILKLGYFGVYTTCGGGGYINICIIHNYEYFWTNAGLIASVFFVLSIILLIVIKFLKNKKIKILLAFIILFLGIISRPLFYIISPDFKFYYTDEKLEYMDKDYNPKNVDLYLEYMGKYCNDNIDNFLFKNVKRDSMCSGRYLYDFKTIEDYKKVFDFANKNNMRELYRLTYIGAKRFGLEKIIKGYNDDTFYGYIIDRSNNINLLNLILNKVNNNLYNILKVDINSIKYFYDNEKLFNQDKGYEYWNNLSIETYKKLKQIKTINTKIF